MEDYLASLTRRPSTKQAYENDLMAFYSWCEVNDVDAADPSALTINWYLAEEQARGLADTTTYRRRGTLERFFRFLVQAGIRSDSPFDDDRIAPRMERDRTVNTEFVPIEKVRALIQSARERGPVSHAAVCLMAIHGLKASEVCSLRVEDVQERRGRTVIAIRNRKRGDWTPLIEPTSNAVSSILEHRPSRGPLLTNDEGRALTYSNLRYRIRQVAEAAALESVPNPAGLRNTAAALAMGRGVPVQQVLDLLGTLSDRHLWNLAEQVRPHYYAHAAEAVATTVLDLGHLDEAERLLMDNDVHPAVPLMAAGAAMESALREWTREEEVSIRNERKASLASYGAALKGAGFVKESFVQTLVTITEARDDAAHGWFDRVTPGKAQRIIDTVRHLLESHDRPIP